MTAITIVDGVPHVDGVPSTPEAVDSLIQSAALAESAALDAALAGRNTVRTTLADALDATALHPLPSPEDEALLASQVQAALDGFTALSDPPADVVALAAALVSWKATR